MKVSTTQLPLSQIEADAVVVGVHQDEPLPSVVEDLGSPLHDQVRQLRDASEFLAKPNELVPIFFPSQLSSRQLLLAGLGPRDRIDPAVAFQAAATASRQLAAQARSRVGFYLDSNWPSPVLESAVSGAVVGCQGSDLYRAERKRYPFEELLWSTGDTRSVDTGHVLGESVNCARRLVDEPPDAMYPESFADAARTVADQTGLQIEVWDQAKLESESCRALLAVARGSARPPALVILKHPGAPQDTQRQIALVGKGVTFDSGGLSLKPSEGMLTMKCDMAGAATVLAAMQAIAKLQLPVNVIGVMGLVENMVSGNSYKLGDVVTARNGTTIEIHNTDAEGRLVLADALDVAIERGASHLVDVATLTGACVVALGMDVAGLMTNDQDWCDQVSAAAGACGEAVWQLPMFEAFDKQIDGEIADIKNVGEGRWGGAITAAKFLQRFVQDRPWTHVDIAGPAFREKPTSWGDYGATGFLARTLVQVIRKLASDNA